MAGKLTVVLSQGQSKSPEKRNLEEDLVAALVMERDVDVSLVPHLYDLTEDHSGLLYLRSLKKDFVLLSWSYPRAAHWVLDRMGVKGNIGKVLLEEGAPEEDEDFSPDLSSDEEEDESGKGIGALGIPDRNIYSVDLRTGDSCETVLQEIRRISAECHVETVSIQPILTPETGLKVQNAAGGVESSGSEMSRHLQEAPRRWYPVIDYDRCTNCMECIDFCLFGVYGVDLEDRILVEQQDSCKKGCPACSRVCPENAIIFPQHKTPGIAGSADDLVSGLKIDLSQLFGAPDAMQLAAQERDVELVKAGRLPPGEEKSERDQLSARKMNLPKDDLDGLMDALEELEI